MDLFGSVSSQKAGADPSRPIDIMAMLFRIREQIFPHPKETPITSPAPIGSSGGLFGAVGTLGPAVWDYVGMCRIS